MKRSMFAHIKLDERLIDAAEQQAEVRRVAEHNADSLNDDAWTFEEKQRFVAAYRAQFLCAGAALALRGVK